MSLLNRMEVLVKNNPFLNKTDIVYTIILDEILLGNLTGGHKINQEELSAQLCISRTPVRDALNKLSAEGYLIKEESGGYYVYSLKMEDYITINEFRSMMELFSAELAVKHISNDDLLRLKQNVSLAQKAANEKNIKEFSELDAEFHKILIKASQNPLIMQTYEEYEQKFHLFRILTLSEDMLPSGYRWHRKIYDAIEASDTEGAVKAARMHRDNTINGAVMMCKKRASANMYKAPTP